MNYFSNINRIENHAEHGGTLNEHQLNRLVSTLTLIIVFINKFYLALWSSLTFPIKF